jgi:hypothetical protein
MTAVHLQVYKSDYSLHSNNIVPVTKFKKIVPNSKQQINFIRCEHNITNTLK